MTTTSTTIDNFSPWELIRRGERFETLIFTYIGNERHFLFRVENPEFNGDLDSSEQIEHLTAQKITENDVGLSLGYQDLKLGWVCESCKCCNNKRPKVAVEAKENLCQFINILSNELFALSMKKKCSRELRTKQFVWLSADEFLVDPTSNHASLEDIGLGPEKIKGLCS